MIPDIVTNPEFTGALTQVLIAFVGLIAVLITIIGPIVRVRAQNWAAKQLKQLEETSPEYVDRIIRAAASLAVTVVEATNLQGLSEEKLAQAEEIAEAWLKDIYGYEVDLARIREAIEFVLFEFKQDPERTNFQ